MLMEDEARSKWCPMVRATVEDIESNRSLSFADASRTRTCCIASQCMAWRSPNGVTGYCGLAGKPDEVR